MPSAKLILLGGFPLSHKIPERLGGFVRNPNRGQISVTVTVRQLQGVPSIRLDSISRLLRYQAWCHHLAIHPQLRQLPIQYEPCRPCFIAGAQMFGRTKPLDEPADRFFPVDNRSEAPYLTVRLAHCYRDSFSMDI
jgi:hypothetical protein